MTWSSSRSTRSWSRWSKFHERIVLATTLIVLICLFHSHLQRRIDNFRYNMYAFTHSSTTAQQPVSPTPDPAWSEFAYSFFAYDSTSLCSALVHLRTLQRSHSKPTRLLSYPALWTSSDAPLQDSIVRLLQRAEQEYGATLQPVSTPSNSASATEYGKLLTFNQTQFSRVANLDTSSTKTSTLLKPLDEMFQFSEADIAMPRAYWDASNPGSLSDLILLVRPDALTFERLASRFSAEAYSIDQGEQHQPSETFMSTLSKVFDEATFLPHRDFLLRTTEFTQTDHSAYLNSFDEIWDAERVIEDAKLVVFSDDEEAETPSCTGSNAQARTRGGVVTCAEREIWEWLRRDRDDRRMAICGDLKSSSFGNDGREDDKGVAAVRMARRRTDTY